MSCSTSRTDAASPAASAPMAISGADQVVGIDRRSNAWTDQIDTRKFDLLKAEFVGDPEANRLRSRAMREPWCV